MNAEHSEDPARRRFRWGLQTRRQHPKALAAGPANPGRALLGLFVVSLVFSVGIGGVLNFVFPISPREAHLLIRSLGIWGPIGVVVIVTLLIVFIPCQPSPSI